MQLKTNSVVCASFFSTHSREIQQCINLLGRVYIRFEQATVHYCLHSLEWNTSNIFSHDCY